MDKHNFKKILKKVEKPARYLGNEINSIHKDTTNENRVDTVCTSLPVITWSMSFG